MSSHLGAEVRKAGPFGTRLLVADEHSPLLDWWLKEGGRGLSVCHIDFHCDMRGLLIDRRRGRARYVGQSDPFMNRVDSGSFLAHAIMKGSVTNLRWVHDTHGGRRYDDLYCVKYETDLSAVPYLLAGRKHWVPLTFAEQTFDDWGGPQSGEQLSIDWDGLAFAEYGADKVKRLQAEILERECLPATVFLARSPEYSRPDRALFDEFVAKLEKRFATGAVYLPPKPHKPLNPSRGWTIYHQLEYRVLRVMRLFGLY